MSERLTTRERLMLYAQNEGELHNVETFTLVRLLDAFPDLLPLELVISLEALAKRDLIAWEDDKHRTFRLCQPIAMRYEDMVRETLATMRQEFQA